MQMAVMYTKRETRVHHERVFVGSQKSQKSQKSSLSVENLTLSEVDMIT